MKKIILLVLCTVLFFACGGGTSQENTADPASATSVATLDRSKLEGSEFMDLFRDIRPTELNENVFKVFSEDYAVITSGVARDYNSMVASYGGWGILFEEPAAWCFLRANRYTLEYIRRNGTYTLSYFDDEDKESIMIFGTSSGRDTEKMNTHSLHPVQTPDGNITYKEARLIIECELSQITSVHPEDYSWEKGKTFVQEGYENAKDYHKLVFGRITHIWVRK
ncbi:MAG: flavin reductase [Bacteroides sp.]|nr:flavin reductase [Bacteroides sp.]